LRNVTPRIVKEVRRAGGAAGGSESEAVIRRS
jgi:hypothetical protein